MSDDRHDEKPTIDSETAVAIATAVILHRSAVEAEVQLLGNGESDEGFWGRAGRAGPSSVLTHRPRRG
jgi:hypothetical protein